MVFDRIINSCVVCCVVLLWCSHNAIHNSNNRPNFPNLTKKRMNPDNKVWYIAAPGRHNTSLYALNYRVVGKVSLTQNKQTNKQKHERGRTGILVVGTSCNLHTKVAHKLFQTFVFPPLTAHGVKPYFNRM